jgi:hypothetical protein
MTLLRNNRILPCCWPAHWYRRGGRLALVVIAALLSGCTTVSPADQKDLHPPLMVSRAGDTAFLSWESKTGALYTILYTDGPRQGTDWQPLAGAVRVPGTGGEIRIQDRVPDGQVRSYRLMVLPSR